MIATVLALEANLCFFYITAIIEKCQPGLLPKGIVLYRQGIVVCPARK